MFGGVPTGGHMLGGVPYTIMPQQHYQQMMMPSPGAGTVPVMMSGHLQGVYHLPVQPVLMSHQTRGAALHRSGMPTPEDQCKWIEERQRLHEKLLKERDYHIQQQRLRDFHSGGNQKLHADRLIQTMLGKLEEPKRKAESPAAASSVDVANARSTVGVSEEQKSQSPMSAFLPSQKARDWSNLGDLQNVFSASTMTPGLPQWCQEGSPLPAVYAQVENYVTKNGVLDTSLLYPVLVSSGLSRETLGQIWSLANRHTPGMLTRPELNAVLALVALAQNACQITSLDILHTVHQAPIPLLNQVVAQPLAPPLPSSLQQPQQPEEDDFDDFKCATGIASPCVPPTVVTNSVGSRLANHHSSGSTSKQVDAPEYSGFQQGTVSLQAPRTVVPVPSVHSSKIPQVEPSLNDTGPEVPQKWVPTGTSRSIPDNSSASASSGADLMSTNDDKYSVFRDLTSCVDVKPSPQRLGDDDYGDFLSGSVDVIPEPATTLPANGVGAFGSDFQRQVKPQRTGEPAYEFSEFQSATSDTVTGLSYGYFRTTRQPVAACDNVAAGFHVRSNSNDFGDFMSPSPSGPDNGKTELDSLSLINSFFKLKDSGSIESQSVSSLDLASDDVQLDIGRHGSVPSLDLKVSGGYDQEEESGDTEASVSPITPADSLSATAKSSEDDRRVLPSPAQESSHVPHFDRYSLMRAETPMDPDVHGYEWQRCLKTCHELIGDAFKTFNGISSSNVSNEVMTSEEGENYLKNIVEIYRIVLRISMSARRCRELHLKLKGTLDGIEGQWNNLLSFVMGSSVFSNEECFKFSSYVLDESVENLKRACGVCLLDVQPTSGGDDFKLTYGGRQYHAACANFWVNFVDSLLPSLAFKSN